jgi:hypothetical protein
LDCHFTAPVFLSKATIEGASGEGMFLWVSSTPLPVMMKTESSSATGEQLVMLWGNTPSLSIMSTFQTSLGASPAISGLMS